MARNLDVFVIRKGSINWYLGVVTPGEVVYILSSDPEDFKSMVCKIKHDKLVETGPISVQEFLVIAESHDILKQISGWEDFVNSWEG